MSQSVARLKELLFDVEAQELADLARRLEATASTDAEGRTELARQIELLARQHDTSAADARAAIDDILARAVVTERLTDSVAAILSEALRKAEIAQHSELSDSIAPLVVTTIKAELRNSQDEMVEALYPLTGRMVKAYVASAMKDLADQLNRRIEQAPVMLRLRSIATGRSIAELAMSDGRGFKIDDVLLIRRGTGELLARWPDDAANGREHAISGVLAAINEFANEALSADGELRQIEFGETAVYLRGSPKFLLAARCSGQAPPPIEQLIDEAFLGAIERQQALDKDHRDVGAKQSALGVVGRELSEQVAAEKARLRAPSGGRALKVVAFLVLAPILSWFVYSWYGAFAADRTREAASQAIAANADMTGYLVDIDVSTFGNRVTIAGLTPSEAVRFDVAHQLRRRLPRSAIIDQLTVAPGADVKQPPDLTPEIEALRGDLDDVAPGQDLVFATTGLARAATTIGAAVDDLGRAAVAARTPERRVEVEQLATDATAIRNELSQVRASLEGSQGDTWRARLVGLASNLAALNSKMAATTLPGLSSGSPSAPADAAADQSLRGQVSAVVAQADRAGTLAAAALLAIGLEPQPPPPPAPAAPERTPREKLDAAVRAKAVFFSNGVDYKDAAAAAATFVSLAPIIKETGLLVRVVGYTDEAGGATINSPLAQQRAEKVRTDLVAAGAPETLLAAVGRVDRFDISAGTGEGNPNRRVEFELGFDGETPP